MSGPVYLSQRLQSHRQDRWSGKTGREALVQEQPSILPYYLLLHRLRHQLRNNLPKPTVT